LKKTIRYLKEEADKFEKLFYAVFVFGIIAPFAAIFTRYGIYIVSGICIVGILASVYLLVKDKTRRPFEY